jgi:hypothetical protein
MKVCMKVCKIEMLYQSVAHSLFHSEPELEPFLRFMMIFRGTLDPGNLNPKSSADSIEAFEFQFRSKIRVRVKVRPLVWCSSFDEAFGTASLHIWTTEHNGRQFKTTCGKRQLLLRNESAFLGAISKVNLLP